jgi:hypothetical protein
MGAGRTNSTPNLDTGKIFAGNSSNQAVTTDTIYVDIANSKVGIGTTSPSAKFNVQGSGTIGWGNLGNAFILAGSTSYGIGIDSNEIASKGDNLYFGTIQNHSIIVRTNGANERMRITNTGNVGIGTTAPSYKLSVTTGADIVANFYSTDSKSSILINDDDTSGWLGVEDSVMFMGGSSSGTGSINILTGIGNTGHVGIGTASPSEKLEVDGNIKLPLGSKLYINNSGEYITSTVDGDLELSSRTELRLKANTNTPSTYGALEFYTSNSERMRITSDGKVGIGTTSPNFALDIGGNDLRMEGTYGIRFGGTGSADTNFVLYDSVSNMPAGKLVISTSNRAVHYFSINKSATGDASVEGKIEFNKYGSGNFTGTATYRLAVNSSGDVIEIPIGSGAVDGSGAANKIAIWSDADTLTSDTNLHWDSTNDRLGVGLSNPSYTIHIPDGASNINTDHAIAIGNDADIKLYRHSNTGVNVIEGDGHLNIRTNTITFQNQAGTETLFKAVADAGFEAYYNHSKQFETINQGVEIKVKSIIPSAGNTNGGYWLYGTHAHGFVSNGNGDLRILASTPGGQKEVLRSYITTASRLVIDGNNYYNVGIGTGTPSYKLDVNGEIRSDGYRINLSGGEERAITSTGTDSIQFGDAGVNEFKFKNAAGTSMIINASGNVGIGNTSPSSKLHVTGDTYISGQFGQGVATANKLTNYGAEFRTSGASA